MRRRWGGMFGGPKGDRKSLILQVREQEVRDAVEKAEIQFILKNKQRIRKILGRVETG